MIDDAPKAPLVSHEALMAETEAELAAARQRKRGQKKRQRPGAKAARR